MRIALSLLLLLLSLGLFAQTEPAPIFPSPGQGTTMRPQLTISIPNSSLFRYFLFQVDTAPDFSSPILFQSKWGVSGTYILNYDSMIFDRIHYWRVKSVKVTGTLYDTTSWSASSNFITSVPPRLGTFSKTVSFSGPSGTLSITNTGTLRRELETDTSLSFNSPLHRKDTVSSGVSSDLKVSGLRFGKKYYFRYRDLTSLSISRYSDTATITVSPIGAFVIYPSQSTSDYAPNFFVEVQANTDLNRFECDLDTSRLFNSSLFTRNSFSRSGSKVVFAGNDLYLNRRYYTRVRAITPTDTSGWSDTVMFKTTNTLPLLQKPANNSTGIVANAPLEILSSNRCYTQLQLDTVPDFTSGYLKDTVIFYKDSASSDFHTVSYSLGAYGFARKYYYRARIYNSIDTSAAWKAPFGFTTFSPYVQLTFPYDNSEQVDDNIQLSWSSVKGVGGYHVQLSTDSFANTSFERYIIGQDSFFTPVTLLTNTVYDARIRAFNSVDTTIWLRHIRFKTRLPLVQKVSPFDSAGVLNDSIPLQWKRTAPGHRYEIGVWTGKNFVARIFTDSTTDTLYYYHPPARGKIYFWDVKAIDGDYKQPTWYYGRDWAFIPALAAPVLTTPADGATDQPVFNQRLNWNAVTGAKGYRVEVDVTPSFTGAIKTDVPVNNCVLNNLPKGTTLYWRVRAYSDYYSTYSSTFMFVTKPDVPTAVDEISFASNESFVFYPNPVTELVHISIPESMHGAEQVLMIYGINGQLLKQMTVSGSDYIFSAADLPQGMLMYQVRSAAGVQTGKLFKASR